LLVGEVSEAVLKVELCGSLFHLVFCGVFRGKERRWFYLAFCGVLRAKEVIEVMKNAKTVVVEVSFVKI
jgi:hypothetical protein